MTSSPVVFSTPGRIVVHHERTAVIVTRTRAKRYVGLCSYPGCDYETLAVRTRIGCVQNVRTHSIWEHQMDQREDRYTTMKTPSTDLPEQDKLADFADHLVVFGKGTKAKRDTKFGSRLTVEANVWVHIDGAWRDLGPSPIFWATVGQQVMDAGDEEVGGVLTQGTERNVKEWQLLPATSKEHKAALAKWSPDGSF